MFCLIVFAGHCLIYNQFDVPSNAGTIWILNRGRRQWRGAQCTVMYVEVKEHVNEWHVTPQWANRRMRDSAHLNKYVTLNWASSKEP